MGLSNGKVMESAHSSLDQIGQLNGGDCRALVDR
ncbi:hypothetical protein RLEG12_25550 [Rhizobium leguminosarum bv. trifolii CB782]|nr:hypothetical protein RLEG12_25550 [Rhizobium leguminosarum bv. trifolii CB782]